MAGLTREGFTPSTYQEIIARISAKLEAFSSGIDLSSEAPDGQLVEIFSFEVSQLWSELSLVYNSYNPLLASGDGLRNIGLITGLPFGAATRSQVNVNLVGVTGTIIPKGSLVSDDNDNEFVTSFDATIPATVQAISKVSGTLNVSIGTITTIVSAVSGWVSVNNTVAGYEGKSPQTETQYRNLRNRTVLRNFTSVADTVKARLSENLGIGQVTVLNNDDPAVALPDGTPANTIHVTVGEIDNNVTDAEIALIILNTKGLGCPTFGSTTVSVEDSQGNSHDISFSKAIAKTVYLDVEILFLEDEYAGAEEAILSDLLEHINGLAADEDVIWSRLFGIITPYAKAQVNVLETSFNGSTYSPSNLVIASNEYASTVAGNITITVVN